MPINQPIRSKPPENSKIYSLNKASKKLYLIRTSSPEIFLLPSKLANTPMIYLCKMIQIRRGAINGFTSLCKKCYPMWNILSISLISPKETLSLIMDLNQLIIPLSQIGAMEQSGFDTVKMSVTTKDN